MKYGLLLIPVFALACAHSPTDDEEVRTPPKNEFESAEPMTGGAFFAPFAVLYQLGKVPSGSSQPVIWGQCRVMESDETGKQLAPPYPCPETFVEAVEHGATSGPRAWIDADGNFEIPIEKGRSYLVKAVCERYSIRSSEVRVIKPGKISLTIFRKKRDLR